MFGWLQRSLYRWALKRLPDPAMCGHDWWVYSTSSRQQLRLEVMCRRCQLLGSVPDPSTEEWERAYNAPTKNYRWDEPGRVETGRRALTGLE